MKVNCENPVIMKVYYIDDILKTATHILGADGHLYPVSKHTINTLFYNLRKELINLCKLGRRDDFNDSKVVAFQAVNTDGITTPIFQIVPCGKCILCRHKRHNEWSERCFLESQSYSSLPLLITLTYDEPSLLIVPNQSLDVSYIQEFMKNLRKRYQNTDCIFRYIACGEYGSHTMRPHYHILLWGFDPYRLYPSVGKKKLSVVDKGVKLSNTWTSNVEENFKNFEKLLGLREFDETHSLKYRQTQKCWKYGHVDVRICHNSQASSYVCKYMYKSDFIDPKRKPPFTTFSKGLGKATLLQYINFAQEHPNISTLEVFDKFSGKSKTCHLTRYISSILFPHLGQLHSEVRKYTLQLIQDVNDLAYLRGISGQVYHQLDILTAPFALPYLSGTRPSPDIAKLIESKDQRYPGETIDLIFATINDLITDIQYCNDIIDFHLACHEFSSGFSPEQMLKYHDNYQRRLAYLRDSPDRNVSDRALLLRLDRDTRIARYHQNDLL